MDDLIYRRGQKSRLRLCVNRKIGFAKTKNVCISKHTILTLMLRMILFVETSSSRSTCPEKKYFTGSK